MPPPSDGGVRSGEKRTRGEGGWGRDGNGEGDEGAGREERERGGGKSEDVVEGKGAEPEVGGQWRKP